MSRQFLNWFKISSDTTIERCPSVPGRRVNHLDKAPLGTTWDTFGKHFRVRQFEHISVVIVRPKSVYRIISLQALLDDSSEDEIVLKTPPGNVPVKRSSSRIVAKKNAKIPPKVAEKKSARSPKKTTTNTKTAKAAIVKPNERCRTKAKVKETKGERKVK